MSADRVILYGLKSCDTVRRARKAAAAAGLAVDFHDYRADGIDAALAARIISALGLERVVNRRGTSWRTLDDVDKARAETAESAATLLAEVPALLKRPVWHKPVAGDWRLGFAPADQAEILAWAKE